jgi:hypothetical protein
MFIDVWYDPNTTSWVTQLKDKEENQIGEAQYTHSKKEAMSNANDHKREHENAAIRVYKRDGELQRMILQ